MKLFHTHAWRPKPLEMTRFGPIGHGRTECIKCGLVKQICDARGIQGFTEHDYCVLPANHNGPHEFPNGTHE
jgi:hypothetical protein